MATWKVQTGVPPLDNSTGTPPVAETVAAAWPDGTQAFIDQRSAQQPQHVWSLTWLSGDASADTP